MVRRLTRMLWCASWGGQFGGRRHALDGDYDSVADECQRNRVPAGVCVGRLDVVQGGWYCDSACKGRQSRCEYSARARDERSSKEKLSPPAALFASSSPPTSSASLAQHLRHAPLGTSAGSSIIDADLCPTHHRGPSIASVQCQPP